MSKTIFIDAGHGGRDPGAVSGKRFEKDDNLALAKAVRAKLAALGFGVVMAREGDNDVTLAARTSEANRLNADMLVSIHRNIFLNPIANGTEVWVFSNPSAVETDAAQKVMTELAAVGIQSNRGVKRGNYHVLRESKMPAMMIELGFLSNARDNELFDTKLDAYAAAIAKGVCHAFGIACGENAGKPPPDAPGVLYRVQVGAFQNREAAESLLLRVQAKWPEAFITKS